MAGNFVIMPKTLQLDFMFNGGKLKGWSSHLHVLSDFYILIFFPHYGFFLLTWVEAKTVVAAVCVNT